MFIFIYSMAQNLTALTRVHCLRSTHKVGSSVSETLHEAISTASEKLKLHCTKHARPCTTNQNLDRHVAVRRTSVGNVLRYGRIFSAFGIWRRRVRGSTGGELKMSCEGMVEWTDGVMGVDVYIYSG